MKLAPEVAEVLGTFGLVFAGCAAAGSAAVGNYGTLAIAVVFGLIVLAMVHTFGHVSGAHINPAVTLAFAVTGHFPWQRVPSYIAAQLIGGTAAGLALVPIFGEVTGQTSNSLTPSAGFLVEFLASALLMLVVASVATDGRAVGSAAGAAIGGTVALDAIWAGPLTNASMNPARSLGPAIAAGDLSGMLLYIAAPVLGMLAGALLYEAVRIGQTPLGRRHTP